MNVAATRLRWIVLVALAVTLSNADGALAQAWLPPPGTGSVTLAYEYTDGGDHLFPSDSIDGLNHRGYVAEGKRWFLGETIAHTVTAQLDIGVSSRVALSGGLAWVRSRYEGRSVISPSADDGFFHGGIQDWNASIRFAAIRRPVLVTPFAGFSAPARDYESGGHSSIGSGLREMHLGLHVGRDLAPFWRRGYVQASYSYGFVEDPEDLSIDRRRVDVEIGWFVTLRLTTWGTLRWLDTVGGEEWITDDPSDDSHGSTSLVNSQLGAARSTVLGGGASYEVLRDLSVFVGVFTVVDGENIEDAVFTYAGVSVPFEAPWRKARRRARR